MLKNELELGIGVSASVLVLGGVALFANDLELAAHDLQLTKALAGRLGRVRGRGRVGGRDQRRGRGADVAHHAGGREKLEQKRELGLGEDARGLGLPGRVVVDLGCLVLHGAVLFGTCARSTTTRKGYIALRVGCVREHRRAGWRRRRCAAAMACCGDGMAKLGDMRRHGWSAFGKHKASGRLVAGRGAGGPGGTGRRPEV